MNLKFQSSAINELSLLAKSDRHSVLIEGPVGCGKSYLAKYYGTLLGVVDFASVPATVQGIRDALDASYNLTSPIVFCIENLDTGVPSASYTLLKFLEEPSQNVYIVVTCRNRFNVPDTIISRSTCVTVAYPTDADVVEFAKETDIAKYTQLSNHVVWSGVKALNDVDTVYRMTPTQLSYFQNLPTILQFKDTVASIVWQLGHFEDNSETNLQFIFNFIVATSQSDRVKHHAIECVRDLLKSRLASHAVLAKFVFECKYGD